MDEPVCPLHYTTTTYILYIELTYVSVSVTKTDHKHILVYTCSMEYYIIDCTTAIWNLLHKNINQAIVV